MNARQIEIFCAIMRDGTLTAAAEAFGVSQPAMSKALRQFEEQIGYRLFDCEASASYLLQRQLCCILKRIGSSANSKSYATIPTVYV